jgi:hypothetical protein
MKRSMGTAAAIVLVGVLFTLPADVQAQRKMTASDGSQDDPMSLGKRLSYWLEALRSRDPERMGMAYDAILELGPAASNAVPELTRIVAEPFTPIHPGVDDGREVLLKLRSIFTRAGAVDSLGAIGEPAAPAAASVIQWALTIRVLPPEKRSPQDDLFIELVGMDVMERMRGAGTVAQFGPLAAPAVLELVKSSDGERRKFAAAILNEESLPIAEDLMKSKSCRDRMLGISLLADMWPVVAASHLETLKDILACGPDDLTEGLARKAQSPLPD